MEKKKHGGGVQREPRAKKKMDGVFFRRFWVKEPRHSEKKCQKLLPLSQNELAGNASRLYGWGTTFFLKFLNLGAQRLRTTGNPFLGDKIS